MGFQSEALNELAGQIAGASRAAQAAAADVSTKQTVGLPPSLDVQILNSDATLDPSVAFVLLGGDSNPVTLTLPPVADVEGKQYVICAVNIDNPVTVQADPSDAGFVFGANLGPGGGMSFVMPSVGYTVVLNARILGPGLTVWIPTSTTDVRGATINAQAFAPTIGDGHFTLPPAASNLGLMLCLKNIASAGHDEIVSPDGSDTIDGAATPIAIADGDSLILVRDQGVPTNWITSVGTDVTLSPSSFAFTSDTTAGDLALTLPAASASGGTLQAYRNIGTGGHSLTVNRAGSDTIDGSATGVALADGQWAAFIREDGSTTNWISLVEPVDIDPSPPVYADAFLEDTSLGVVNVTLPDAGVSEGLTFWYKNTGSAGHDVVVAADTGDTIDGAATLAIPDGRWCGFVRANGSTTNWVSLLEPDVPADVDLVPAVTAVSDTTAGNAVVTLPDATTATQLQCYKNTGGGGNTLTINRAGTDTIDGGTSGVVLADGKTATLARDSVTVTNWITIVPPV